MTTALAERNQAAWREFQQPQLRFQQQYSGRYTNNNLNAGGLFNAGTGLGTNLDKSQGNVFLPTRIWSRHPLEVLCVESWVARNAIDIPIDDMFIRFREYVDDDESAVEAMQEATDTMQVKHALNQALKAGDQYGTGVVVMVSGEDHLDTELNPDRIREGDLEALHYFDRYDLSVFERDEVFRSPTFGQPLRYLVTPSVAGTMPQQLVHRSRILRFDGIRPPTRSGFSIYDQDFGVSVLVPIIISIMEDQTLASSVAHLSQEASISVLNIAGLRETIAGGGDGDEASPSDIGQQVNAGKSNFRLMMLDEKGREEFTRVAVAFGGLSDLMERFQSRVASARKIPRTRFLGSPPIGMSATGEGDMKNYILMMEAEKEQRLDLPLMPLDMLLARHIGLKEPLEYEWQSLLDLSDMEIAQASKTKAEALEIGVTNNAIDEDEMRDALKGDPVFGLLPGPAPEVEMPEMMPGQMNGQIPGEGPITMPAPDPTVPDDEADA